MMIAPLSQSKLTSNRFAFYRALKSASIVSVCLYTYAFLRYFNGFYDLFNASIVPTITLFLCYFFVSYADSKYFSRYINMKYGRESLVHEIRLIGYHIMLFFVTIDIFKMIIR